MKTSNRIRTALAGAATLVALASSTIAPMSAFAQTAPDGSDRKPPPTRSSCPAYDTKSLEAPYVFKYGLSGTSLRDDFYGDGNVANDGSYNDDGYRPDRLTGYVDNGDTRFATRWVNIGRPAWSSKFGLSDAEFHDRFLKLRDEGYRIVDASGYNTAGGVRYADIWEKNDSGIGWAVTRDVSAASFNTVKADMQSKGMAPTRVEGYEIPGKGAHFIIVWEAARGCKWDMQVELTGAQYQALFNANINSMRPIHVDSYSIGTQPVRFGSIFWAQDGPAIRATHGQHWYLFQRSFNNNSCDGYVLENFYGSELSDGWNTYGGIWTFRGVPVVDENSSLSARVNKQVNCTDGRAGAAVMNITTGENTFAHADQQFGSASAIKATILYSVLRKADAEGLDLTTETLNAGAQYGSNGGNLLVANQDYTIDYLAQIMITSSHNWATNRLMDWVGIDEVNAEIDNLGLTRTVLNRYMSGTNSPSAHGLGTWGDDFRAGFDNFSTPREFATFYQLVWENDGLLSAARYDRFFAITGAAPVVANDVLPGGYDPNSVQIWNKAGSMTYGGNPGDYDHRPQLGGHQLTSEAGLMQFDNGEVVAYAVFADERDPGSSASAIACIGFEVAREFSDDDPGATPAICQ